MNPVLRSTLLSARFPAFVPVLFLVLFLAFFLAPLLAPVTANAAQENPKQLQGLWSQPDCANTDSLLVLSQYFLLYSDRAGIIIDTPFSWQEDSEDGKVLYGLQPASGKPAIFNRSNDGLVRIRQTALPENKSLHLIWNETEDGTENRPDAEFGHCTKLFDSTPSLGQTEINTVFFLDMMMEEPSCAGITAEDDQTVRSGLGQQCRLFLFTLADQNQDGWLDRSELARVYRQISFLDHAMHHCPHLPPQPEQKQATLFAEDVFRANGNRNLSPEDMLSLIGKAKSHSGEHPALSSFLNHAQNLHRLVPFMLPPENGSAAPACAHRGEMKIWGDDAAGQALQTPDIRWNAPRISDADNNPEPANK